MTSSTSVSPKARQRPPAPGATVPPRAVRIDRYGVRPEVYVASDALARTITAIIAVLVVLGMVRWSIEVDNRFQVPSDIRPYWFRLPQLALGVAGLLAALVQAVYLFSFTATGIVWRHLRGVTMVFAVLASAWTALWFLDRFVLDAFFLD